MTDVRPGAVFWLTDCPGLHGHKLKDRFVTVIAPEAKIPDDDGLVLVIPISRSSLSEYTVSMPNKQENPQTKSGLLGPCRAVCDEAKQVPHDLLNDKRGFLTSRKLSQILESHRRYVTDQMA